MNLAAPSGIRWTNAEWEGVGIGSATDRSLIERARLGDLDAFESIARARMDAVFRLSFAIVGDEADAADVAQETFVAAWRQLPRLRDPDLFEAWLQRIAVNAARMAIRSRSRRRVREIAASAAVDRAAVSPGPGDDATRLEVALTDLTPDQRALLALHYLEGRGVAEIADVLGIPAGTVKSRLFAARHALDAALQAEAE